MRRALDLDSASTTLVLPVADGSSLVVDMAKEYVDSILVLRSRSVSPATAVSFVQISLVVSDLGSGRTVLSSEILLNAASAEDTDAIAADIGRRLEAIAVAIGAKPIDRGPSPVDGGAGSPLRAAAS